VNVRTPASYSTINAPVCSFSNWHSSLAQGVNASGLANFSSGFAYGMVGTPWALAHVLKVDVSYSLFKMATINLPL
jgi:hypothetical protein